MCAINDTSLDSIFVVALCTQPQALFTLKRECFFSSSHSSGPISELSVANYSHHSAHLFWSILHFVLSVLGLFFYAVAYRRIHTIISPVVAEYDAMHPQLQFHQQSMQQQQEGNRWKRGVMPTVKFNAPDIERDGDFWNNAAQDILKKQLQKNTLNKNVAKNIILFLGDGMSIPTLAATRIYMGGEDRELSFEKFPYNGMSKVKCR